MVRHHRIDLVQGLCNLRFRAPLQRSHLRPGPGIAEEHLPRVFEEFYRVRETRDRDVEGIGLGLSIVRRLGRLTGIEVTLRSRVGRGTAVTLTACRRSPRKPFPAATIPCRPACSPVCGCAWWKMIANVLRATSALLERWGCTVQAETEADGWRTDCDILVVDYDLGPTPPASSASSGYGGNAERRYRRW